SNERPPSGDDGILQDSGPVKEFIRRAAFDQDELVGARWWNESFTAFAGTPLFGRREAMSQSLQGLVVGGGLVAFFTGIGICSSLDDDDSRDVINQFDALDLQRRDGWSVGHAQQSLRFSGGLSTDVDNTTNWKTRLNDLLTALAPDDMRLLPHATTTLFQALAAPMNGSLRMAMQPVNTPAMDAVFARGKALRELLTTTGAPSDLALVLDLPGPESVALAAALAPTLAPLFQFDNWPHPLGVVPSHLTLGACLYYLPRFEAATRTRPAGGMPVFVLDANRLTSYRDDANQFDNRYMAPLPSAASLLSLGIKRLLYVRPSTDTLTELDDLNADFVAFERAGIPVRAVGLNDFQRADVLTSAGEPVFHYGGAPYHHIHFWHSYGWSRPGALRSPRNPPPMPPRLAQTAQYRPVARPTLFNTRAIGGMGGIGKQKPSGFGRVSIRTPGSGGSSRRRSGSFGRSRSSYSS
ncbi:MAG TPA: hypothetical protein VGG33_22900, partial [Polyangia bacterium]